MLLIHEFVFSPVTLKLNLHVLKCVYFYRQGRKSGKGCYIYQPGLKTREVNPELGDILEKYKLTPNPAV